MQWLPLAARTTPSHTQQGDSHDSCAVYRPSAAMREGVSLLAHLHPSSLGISSRRARVRRTFRTRQRARVNPNPNPIIDALHDFIRQPLANLSRWRLACCLFSLCLSFCSSFLPLCLLLFLRFLRVLLFCGCTKKFSRKRCDNRIIE